MKVKVSIFLLSLLLLSPAMVSADIPDQVFAPYVDMTLWPTPSLVDIYEETGQKYFTLALITQGDECTPAWAGTSSLDMDSFQDEIAELRAAGGDIIISLGGANGTELAMGCEDEDRLLQAYQEVIDAYSLTWVDFDIEGAAVADTESIDRRSSVIRQLQVNNPDLKVAFCLPVLPQGLTDDGLYVIQSAMAANVDIDVVNVMVMDYGDSAAPDPDGQMGEYAIEAAENTYDQMEALGLDTKIGVTPMSGQNDVSSEVFYIEDAGQLLSWAQSTSWVTLLSMWSIGRDNGDCYQGSLSPSCSGLEIDAYAFTNIFKDYTVSGSDGNNWPTAELTTPTDGQTFDDDPDITIEANAADSDGTIVQVEFFYDGTSLGTDTESPYGIEWADAPVGEYELTAVATDDQGGTTESSAVSIEVTEDGGDSEDRSCDGLPDYPEDIGSYESGQQVQNNGYIYEVREYPHGAWANINSVDYYEPGVGSVWEDAWTLVGKCADN